MCFNGLVFGFYLSFLLFLDENQEKTLQKTLLNFVHI